MAQLNLIPDRGYYKDDDQDQLNLIPEYGYAEESIGASPPANDPMPSPLGLPLMGVG